MLFSMHRMLLLAACISGCLSLDQSSAEARLSLLSMDTIQTYKGAGTECYRDEECTSSCCYERSCTQSQKECAEQRKEILSKIVSQMAQEEQQSTGFLRSTNLVRKIETSPSSQDSTQQEEREVPINNIIEEKQDNQIATVQLKNENQPINSSSQQDQPIVQNEVFAQDDPIIIDATQSQSLISTQVLDNSIELQQAPDQTPQSTPDQEVKSDQNTNSQQAGQIEQISIDSQQVVQQSPLDQQKDTQNADIIARPSLQDDEQAYFTTTVVVLLIFLLLTMVGVVFVALRGGSSMQLRLKEKHWLYEAAMNDSRDDQYIRLL